MTLEIQVWSVTDFPEILFHFITAEKDNLLLGKETSQVSDCQGEGR